MKRKPKVGEIWMVKSDYSWGMCLVRIISTRVTHLPMRVQVLDAKDTDSYPRHEDCIWLMDGDDKFIELVEAA